MTKKGEGYTYVAMTRCQVCRKVVDPDNCVQSGHFRLSDKTKVSAVRHPECNAAQPQSDRNGCFGPWERWMGCAVMEDR